MARMVVGVIALVSVFALTVSSAESKQADGSLNAIDIQPGDTPDATFTCTALPDKLFALPLPPQAVSVEFGEDPSAGAGPSSNAVLWKDQTGTKFYWSFADCTGGWIFTGLGQETMTVYGADPASGMQWLSVITYAADTSVTPWGPIDEPGDDTVIIAAGAPTFPIFVTTGMGDDTVMAPINHAGNLIVTLGDGDDFAETGNGNDIIRGNAGVDIILAHGGNDRALGGTGNDNINGGVGNDFLGGFGGNDVITGGSGDDTIFGGFGADTITGGGGNDKISGLIGNDTISGDGGNDTLNGDAGNDTNNGGSGNDTVNGGNASDDLFGDGGNDTLNGGKADDKLSGGSGTDVCTGNKHFNGDTADATCEQTFGVP